MRRARGAVVALVAVAVAVAAAGCTGGGEEQPPGATATAAPSETSQGSQLEGTTPLADKAALVPEEGALLGSWVKPQRGETPVEAVASFEKSLGRRLDIVHSFYRFDLTWPTERDTEALANGSIPLISWNGGPSVEVVAGQHDELIAERAAATKELGKPILLRYFWEPEGEAASDRVGSPADYIAAWKHVRGIFDKEGADNVAWVWCPTAFGFRKNTAQPFYPGDDQVDWICADGYSGDPNERGGQLRQFEDVFQPFYDWAAPKGKPLMIAEFGVHRNGEQAPWLREAADVLREKYPAIRAIVYFDSPDKGDWTLRTNPEAIGAYAAFARDPYFNTRKLPELR